MSKTQLKKPMTVSSNTNSAEGLSNFSKNIAETSVEAAKNLTTNLLKNRARGLKVASKSPKTTRSTIPDVGSFYHTGKDRILENLFRLLDVKMSTTKIYPSAPLQPFKIIPKKR